MAKTTKHNRVIAIIIVASLAAIFVLALLVMYLRSHTVAVMQPAGPIALQERNLMYIALGLAALVVIPVYFLTIMIAVKYRASNPNHPKYQPEWDNSHKLEIAWWSIPMVIITILSIITWQTSHSLDPYRPLVSSVKPLTVQVVAMDWKWLFIYPEQNVATVNLLEIPTGTPVNFQLTSATVMNSFWIPQLGGQIYAMPGMSTQLHLQADKAGSYLGSPANISGAGFARMDFTAKAVSPSQFTDWLDQIQQNRPLTATAYNSLARPSDNNPVTIYSPVANDLYNSVINQYMSMNMNMASQEQNQ
jgi:cytochrome o ubiquinol oxidase subunit II